MAVNHGTPLVSRLYRMSQKFLSLLQNQNTSRNTEQKIFFCIFLYAAPLMRYIQIINGRQGDAWWRKTDKRKEIATYI